MHRFCTNFRRSNSILQKTVSTTNKRNIKSLINKRGFKSTTATRSDTTTTKMMDDSFPNDGIMPKKPSQAHEFLQHHPEFDGRGVLVAILDTGIDPGAAGLQMTSDGKKKMVGLLDTSGGGDVDTSKVVVASKNSSDEKDQSNNNQDYITIKGISKKELKIPKSIENPSGKWHVGIKAAYQLFPKGLVKRMKNERKKKWTIEHNPKLVECKKQLDEFDAKNNITGKKKPTLSRELMLERNELKAKVDLLLEQEKNYSDDGPVCDCVVFQGTDNEWRAMIDTSGTGDFQGKRALRSFGIYGKHDDHTYEFEKWDEESQLNYAVNIYDEGNLLSIVVDSGAHGTHVASIVSAFHPEHPDGELNGVAPGAQLVSMKIGDGRLDGMETGPSIIRAFNACANLGVDVINMSFGEPTKLPDYGRIAELARELVERHGVVFVSSAGNAGPALSTVGAPGATSDALIGVGAYVEPQMMLAAYALKPGTTPPPISYTWSSRGPSYDGLHGVTITAPGAAIASVPNWTMMKSRLMNGTSMSSPNAAGGISLILSGLKASNIPYAPWTIKRAIQATASWVPGTEPHAQGRGLIQVSKAFDAAKVEPAGIHSKVMYQINVASSQCRTNAGPAKGIYIREPWESQSGGLKEFIVQVTPKYPEKHRDTRAHILEKQKQRIFFEKKDPIDLEVRLLIRCTEPWIQAPPFMMLSSQTKSFRVSIDLDAVPNSSSGTHHVPFGYIEAYDPNESELLGPLWSVPVTVIKPESCQYGSNGSMQVPPAVSVARLRHDPFKLYENVHFSPGKIVRHFVKVPHGATWMDLTITPGLSFSSSSSSSSSSSDSFCTVPPGSSRTFYVHCLQMNQQSNYQIDELSTSVSLRQEPGVIATRAMPVTPNGTVEICIAQFWSSLGSGPVNIHARFNGVVPNPSEITLSPQNGQVAQVKLASELGLIRVDPRAKLKKWTRSIRPDASKTSIYLMSSSKGRDAILGAYPPETRPTYALELTYTFKQAEKGKLAPKFPRLSEYLYDSPHDSQMCMLYDSNKKLLGFFDAWPKPTSIPKGEITAKVLIRNEDRKALERIRDMPMLVESNLSSDVSLQMYKSGAGSIVGSKQFDAKILSHGETCTLFVAAPQWSDVSKSLPKGIAAGDILHGTITYGRRSNRDTALSGTDCRPGGYLVSWVIPALPSSGPDDPTVCEKDETKKPKSTSATKDDEEKEKDKEDGKELSQQEKDKELYKMVLLPALKSKLSTLESLKKTKVEGLFESVLDQTKDLLSQVPEALLKGEGASDEKTEVDDFRLKVTRVNLQRMVHKNLEKLKVSLEEENKQDQKLDDLLALCDEFVSQIKPDDLLVDLIKVKSNGDLDGVGQTDLKKDQSKRAQERRSWLLEAVVIKMYANKFASDPQAEDLIAKIAESKDLSLVQLKIDRHITNQRYAMALSLLNSKLADSTSLDSLPIPLSQTDVSQLQLKLYKKLQWDHVAHQLENSTNLLQYPAKHLPF